MLAAWSVALSASMCRAGEGVRVERLPDGLRFAIRGDKPTSPAPTLFLFALDCEATLTDPHYNGLAVDLAADGYLGVSLDLPCHGEDTRPDEPPGLAGWRARADRNQPLIAPFVAQASAVLDHLIRDGYTDPTRVAASGTSRGAFAALHFAAADRRIRCALGFSPVTDLLALTEFQGMARDEPVRALGLCSLADELAGLPPRVELHVMPSAGHAVPDGARDLAARCLREQMAR